MSFRSAFASFAEFTYSKVLRISPMLILRIDLINRCNLRCKMCYYNDVLNKEPMKTLTLEEVKQLLETSKDSIREIMLSCGFEPLMSREFKEVIEYIHQNHPKIKMAFCSNGLLLRKDISDALIKNRVNRSEFSIDGVTKKTYENIRINSNFDVVIKNLKYLRDEKKRLKSKFPKVQINYVIQKSNLEEAPRMVKFASELGADFLVFRKVIELNEDFEKVSLEKYQNKFNKIREKIIQESKKYDLQVMIPSSYSLEDKK